MNVIEKSNFYILTGAPGVGKSTVLSELSKTLPVVGEPAREIIAEQRAINGNGLWEKDTRMFVKLLLERSVSRFTEANGQLITYFDRGIADNIAYAAYGSLDVTEFEAATKKYRFNKKVFLLSPWEEIYATDDERNMPFEEVVKFHHKVVEAYGKSGYELIEVPNETVENRVKFIVAHTS